jgi:hypothetical protein
VTRTKPWERVFRANRADLLIDTECLNVIHLWSNIGWRLRFIGILEFK